MKDEKAKQCVVCECGSDTIPLILFEYRGEQLRICSQHLPILIHKPEQLVGYLAGAENLRPAEHDD
jgi:hypothetical protein